MRTLVFGANGLLGSNVMSLLDDRKATVCGCYHSSAPDFELPLRRVDIRNRDAIETVIDEFSPSLVINCAAKTDVDGCERDSADAYAVNADAPETIATICNRNEIDFVHVSTDYVFDGEQTESYTENVEPNPIQHYGRSKSAGEVAVLNAHRSAFIVRISFVYGIHRASGELIGFPAWIRDQLHANTELQLFTDQHVTPSRAGQVAETICDLADAEHSGVFHIACTSCVTPYQFGTVIADLVNADTALLERGKRAGKELHAERPAQTCLDTQKIERALDRPQPTLREDLQAIANVF